MCSCLTIPRDTLISFFLLLCFTDVDHRGVPNNILIEEEPEMAAKYKNKSVAEQNSVDIAWEIFMQPEFKALRDTVCNEFIELRRLRALLVNAVLATDIFDPEVGRVNKNCGNDCLGNCFGLGQSNVMCRAEWRESVFAHHQNGRLLLVYYSS